MVAYDTRSNNPLRDGLNASEHVEETHSLISADKVAGTTVYNPEGDSLGSIHDIMIDKHSGRVAYAVMSFGGFLGMGEKYHPLPWSALTYDADKGGYNVGLTADQLRDAPSYTDKDMEDFDSVRGQSVTSYYNGLGYTSTF
jgi:hypothetical protein